MRKISMSLSLVLGTFLLIECASDKNEGKIQSLTEKNANYVGNHTVVISIKDANGKNKCLDWSQTETIPEKKLKWVDCNSETTDSTQIADSNPGVYWNAGEVIDSGFSKWAALRKFSQIFYGKFQFFLNYSQDTGKLQVSELPTNESSLFSLYQPENHQYSENSAENTQHKNFDKIGYYSLVMKIDGNTKCLGIAADGDSPALFDTVIKVLGPYKAVEGANPNCQTFIRKHINL